MHDLSDIPNGALIITRYQPTIAAGSDAEVAVFTAIGRGYKILSAGFVPDAVLTGSDTTNRSIGLVNKGTGGAGTTAVKAVKAYNTGINAAAFKYEELVTAADAKTVAAGETISFAFTHGSTGLAMPVALLVMVVWPLT